MARVSVPGVAHHVTQHGNNRQRVFFSDADRRLYLKLLSEESRRYGLTILAWCLMDNHIHLVVVPERADSLAKGLGQAHMRYAQIVNARRRRSGHFWQSRFNSCLIQGEYFWWAMRYVERHPVRAGLVRRVWNYPWSSAAAHCGLGKDAAGLLDLAAWARLARGRDWRGELTRPEVDDEMDELRLHTRTGRPLVGEAFLDKLERQTGRRLRPLRVGRPRMIDK